MSRALPSPLDQALEAAVRAPSPHNTQPWRFEVGYDQVNLWLDRDRVLPVADPDAHEARLSCGAALLNLTLSLRSNGQASAVRLLPDADEPDFLASVHIEGIRRSTPLERRLSEAIYRRHTNRRPFFERPVLSQARMSLIAAALKEGGNLEYLDPSSRYSAVADLVRRAEFLQSTDRRFLAEAARWTRRETDSPDGVPLVAAGPPPQFDPAVPLRESHSNATLPPRPYEQQPLVAAVLTRGQPPRADLRGGMVMQRVLLTATSLGLATSFLSQPFETAVTRDELARIFGDRGEVHTLLRIGYGYPTAMTSRRPVSEVATELTKVAGAQSVRQ